CGWARERKYLPLKDVAAAGGWRDTSTLLRYQQPDEATLRAVVEFEGPGRSGAGRKSVSGYTRSHTHTRSEIDEARWDRTSHRASSCPSWARTRTLLLQSQAC